MMYFWVVIAGILGGVLSGLLGIGGGIIYITVLSYLFKSLGMDTDEIVAMVIANSIFLTFFSSMSALLSRWKEVFTYYKWSILIGLGGAMSIVLTMEIIVKSSFYTEKLFTSIIILLMVFMGYRLFKSKEHLAIKHSFNFEYNVLFTGLAAGLVSALSGLGGGIIVVPILTNFYKVPIKIAKNISLSVIAIISFTLSLYNLLNFEGTVYSDYQFGYLLLDYDILFALGIIIGGPLGMKFSDKLSSQWIKIIFALLLGLVVLKKGIYLLS